MIDEKTINNIISIIKKKVNPQKIYLFGSYAYGNPTETSDLDILIIKDKIIDRKKELLQIKKEIISKDYSIDILLLSGSEYNKKKSEGWKIFEDIERKGRLVVV